MGDNSPSGAETRSAEFDTGPSLTQIVKDHAPLFAICTAAVFGAGWLCQYEAVLHLGVGALSLPKETSVAAGIPMLVSLLPLVMYVLNVHLRKVRRVNIANLIKDGWIAATASSIGTLFAPFLYFGNTSIQIEMSRVSLVRFTLERATSVTAVAFVGAAAYVFFIKRDLLRLFPVVPAAMTLALLHLITYSSLVMPTLNPLFGGFILQ